MLRTAVFLLALCATARAADGPRCFAAPLPEGRGDAARLRVLLEGVTTPGDVPLKLRVTAAADGDARAATLGSVGVVAVGRDSDGPRRIASLRLDVTRSLGRLLEQRGAGAGEVKLCVQPVDGRGEPIRGLDWSVEAVRLETRRR